MVIKIALKDNLAVFSKACSFTMQLILKPDTFALAPIRINLDAKSLSLTLNPISLIVYISIPKVKLTKILHLVLFPSTFIDISIAPDLCATTFSHSPFPCSLVLVAVRELDNPKTRRHLLVLFSAISCFLLVRKYFLYHMRAHN